MWPTPCQSGLSWRGARAISTGLLLRSGELRYEMSGSGALTCLEPAAEFGSSLSDDDTCFVSISSFLILSFRLLPRPTSLSSRPPWTFGDVARSFAFDRALLFARLLRSFSGSNGSPLCFSFFNPAGCAFESSTEMRHASKTASTPSSSLGSSLESDSLGIVEWSIPLLTINCFGQKQRRRTPSQRLRVVGHLK
jgi:hypothetical protein